jgi:VIT1/CCC1 family predicted Fe2+/Mn2+ transporter
MTSIVDLIPGLRARRDESVASRLNWLRAGVLGANDGIVSVAAIVVGVAGATSSNAVILTAGLAGLVGGAISMALGEYVSVSSQRDSQKVLVAKGELDLNSEEIASPWHAAFASAIAFTTGGVLPPLSILLIPASVRIPFTFAIVLLALALTGASGAKIGGSPVLRATVRVVIGGTLALAATFIIGHLLGASGIL